MNIKVFEGVIFKRRNRGWRALRLQIGKKVYEYKISYVPFIVGGEEFNYVSISGRSV